MDETATSISPFRTISVIGSLCTSTSNIERSISSGFQPCDIVRLPCGSRSTARMRLPCSASATPRFSVVVVFATPPFWFAKAMTLATVGPPEDRPRPWGRGSKRASAIVVPHSSRHSRVLLGYGRVHGPEMADADHRLCRHLHAAAGHHGGERRPAEDPARPPRLLHRP